MNKILNINPTSTGSNSSDAETRIKELEKELQKHRVEEGRLKKAQEELEAAKARASELEAQLRNRNIDEDKTRIRGYAPEDSIADPDTLDAVAQMTAKTIHESENKFNERFAQMEAKMQNVTGTMSQRVISESIEAKYPGLISRLNNGDLSSSWRLFLNELDQTMGTSYSVLSNQAFNSGNENLMFYVIDKFLSNTGSMMQYGKESVAHPTSSATKDVSISESGNKKIYNTIAEAEAMLDKASKDYSAGRITHAQKNAALAEFNSAFSEGRILEMKNR